LKRQIIHKNPKWVADYHQDFRLGERSKFFKVCSKCGETKLLIKFSPDKRLKRGRVNICKECRSKYYLERYYQNKEKILEKAKAYRQNHK